jgi:hypothetical protein
MIVVHDEVYELSVQAHYHQMKHLFKHSFIDSLTQARHHPGNCQVDGKENPEINISTNVDVGYPPVKVPQLISDSGLPWEPAGLSLILTLFYPE